MDNQQEQDLSSSKNRSLSLPVLTSEDAVIKKIQEQDGLIALIQAQMEFQTEVISKHDKMFEDLLTKVHDLTSKVKVLEDYLNKEKESADRDAQKSALWAPATATGGGSGSGGGGLDNLSIADMVKETAEQTLGVESGYVYDEKLGLYFDQSSGYYYDPVKQLFYNGHTKTYYSYDATTGAYQIHSQDSVKRKKTGKSKPKKATKQQKISKADLTDVSDSAKTDQKLVSVEFNENDSPRSNTTEDKDSESNSKSNPQTPASDMEEGELDSSAPSSPETSAATASSDEQNENEQMQVNYPPCIRAVVQSPCSSSSLKAGTLFLIPYTGGTIGSSGKQHAVLLPTTSVDKKHAKIYFRNEPSETGDDEDSEIELAGGKYFIVDLGSKEGTYLNRTRISESGIPSEPYELVHGSTLQVGDVTLLIHIHPGDFTCGHCEPGLLIQKDPMYEYTGKDAETVRRAEMKKMKKKYGLDRKNENVTACPSDANYVDRAKDRRQKVGSDNPFAKTEVSSTEAPIRETNVGFKMLKKMGWKGEGLGNPQNSGIKEPIKCEVKNDRGGLGLIGPALPPKPKGSKQKSEKLAKTIERFQETLVENQPEPAEDFDF